MGSFVFNVARGRTRYFYDQVRGSLVQATGVAGPPNTLIYNGDATSQLMVMAVNVGAVTDAVLADFKSVSLILADASIDEPTNTNYARKIFNDSDLANSAENDTTDELGLDIPDMTWSAVSATGGAGPFTWTDLLVCWKPNSSSADSDVIPISCHDFVKAPSGLDVVAAVNAAGYYTSQGNP